MFSRFFIDRPIFASVLSIVITLAGGISLWVLPLSLYPPISPPTVSVDCNYPGASAQVVSESVATPIEQQVNGVENMMYMSSQCTNDGTYNLTITFKHGMDLNLAQVLVQNRVALALPLLPDVLKQTGVNVRKMSPDILLAIAINSPTNRYDQLFLSNYALLQVRDELSRLPGVSDVRMLGQRDYSMRIWVDPERLAARDMTAGDVVAAIRAQNLQVAAGQIGQPPNREGQPIQIPLATRGRLVEPEQFADLVVKATPDGRLVRVKDIGRVELGAKNQDISGQVNGLASVSMAIFQLPDANALETAEVVKSKIVELSKKFPPGLRYEIRYDTTPFIRESIGEVFKTLRDAIILVALVVLLFLQNWRSAIIPLVAVPVAIVGTFAVMAAIGFSLNNLTLFGLVLAIGIVVDDAIVVVEAVEHHIEHGMAPYDATVQAMKEVSGPVIAIGLVLSAVFVPCAFITGIVGQFFRQFALTIATSTIISAFNSLTLSPALAALLLRPHRPGQTTRNVLPLPFYAACGGWLGWVYLAPRFAELRGWPWVLVAASAAAGLAAGWPANWLLSGVFGLFNRTFKWTTRQYTRVVGGMIRTATLVLLVYGGLLGMTYWAFVTTPTGFIPSQDMGYLLINVQLPDSSSLERTKAVMSRMEKIAHEVPGVKHTQAMSGQSLLLSANGGNFGSMFVILEPFHERPNPVTDRFFAWLDEATKALDANLDGFDLWLSTVRTSDPALLSGKTSPGASGIRYKQVKPGQDNATPVRWFKEHWGLTFKRAFDAVTGGPEMTGRVSRVVNGPPPPKGAKPGPGRFERWARQTAGWKKGPPLSGDSIANVLRGRFDKEVPDAMITVLGPPPVRGVGRAGGFKFMVKDRGSNGPDVLQGQTEALTDVAKTGVDYKDKLVGMTSVFRANVPQIFVDVDRNECMTKEVELKDLFDTLRIYLGSLYVNDFNLFGRTWQVVVQADQRFRNSEDKVRQLKVRNKNGGMVPVGALSNVQLKNGPLVLTRYNMYPAAPINGSAAPGVSSGEAIKLMEAAAAGSLSDSMGYEWTELAYLEIQAGNTAMIVFGFAVVMVFLVLAAQYESWAMPLAVILVVPMCLLSAAVGVKTAFMDINIFTQIGLVVLVGLASKNAILIVEFAKHRREQGETRRQAALDACMLRFRPIVMTSMAFILGVLPLILSQGAGAEMRRTLGVTVFSGMLGVTAFGVFLTPIFFVCVDRLGALRVFHTGPLEKVGDAVLAVLSGRALFGAIRLASRGRGDGDPAPDAPDSNGTGADTTDTPAH